MICSAYSPLEWYLGANHFVLGLTDSMVQGDDLIAQRRLLTLYPILSIAAVSSAFHVRVCLRLQQRRRHRVHEQEEPAAEYAGCFEFAECTHIVGIFVCAVLCNASLLPPQGMRAVHVLGS